MQLNSLSASSYKTFDQCSWKWFLQYQAGFADPSGPSATLGHVAHKVLEILARAKKNNHPQDSKVWNSQYLWDVCVDHYRRERPDTFVKIQKNKLEAVRAGVMNLLDGPGSPLHADILDIEKKFEISLEEPRFLVDKSIERYLKIKGFIDRVDRINAETIEISDFKSGRRTQFLSDSKGKIDSITLSTDIQPLIYFLACRTLYPWARNVIISFIYLVDGGCVSLPMSESDAEVAKAMLAKRMRAVLHQQPSQNKSWACKHICPHGPYNESTCGTVWAEKQTYGLDFVRDKYSVLNYKGKI